MRGRRTADVPEPPFFVAIATFKRPDGTPYEVRVDSSIVFTDRTLAKRYCARENKRTMPSVEYTAHEVGERE